MGRFYNLFAIGEGGQCLLWVNFGLMHRSETHRYSITSSARALTRRPKPKHNPVVVLGWTTGDVVFGILWFDLGT
jgi:hypothetical protein